MLTKLGEVFRAEPVLATGLVTALNGIIALFVPDEVTVAISAFNAALAIIVVRMLVTPVGKAVAAVQDAAVKAVDTVSQTLTSDTVGAAGGTTEAGLAIATGAVDSAVAQTLQAAGLAPGGKHS
jgi:hypothetical protein